MEDEGPDLHQKILELEYEIRDLKKSLVESKSEVVEYKEKYREAQANNEAMLTRFDELEAQMHLMVYLSLCPLPSVLMILINHNQSSLLIPLL